MKGGETMRQLKQLKVTHVSYVDKAANQTEFFLTKSADKPNFTKEVQLVTKADDPQKLVYGVVYAPDVKDSHGDFADAETIEKAAHEFMTNYQQIDKQHDFTTNAGQIVESYIAPVDMTFDETTIAKGTWVLVTKATDEIWENIQKGELTGYSLAGTADVEEVEKATKDIFDKNQTYRDMDSSLSAFRSATWSILDNYHQSDAEKLASIQSEITELSQLISSISPINKSNEQTTKQEKQGFAQTISAVVKSIFVPKNKGDEEMTPEELKKALGDALQPLADRLDAVEKATKKPEVDETDEGEDKKGKKDKKDEALDADAITKAVQAVVEPLNAKIEQLEKSRISNVQETNYQQAEEIEKSSVPGYVNEVFPITEK